MTSSKRDSVPADTPLVNMIGDLVAIGPLRRDLLPLYVRWINDFQTIRTLGVPPRPMTAEAEAAWFDNQAAGADPLFTIYELATWRAIGNTGLHGIDYRNRTATFGIMIGEPECRGKGYGTETARLMLDYAFTALGLHNVMLTVYEFNLAAQRAYRKAGFREIGRRRSAKLMGGKYWDEIFMDCIAEEFESPLLKAIFQADEPRERR
jgi:RimJ/RimL family protein N-acetyltransferase